MAEGHGAVMREVLLHQHMAVEAAHLGNREYADSAEGSCGHRQHLALCHVSPQLAVSGADALEAGVVPGRSVGRALAELLDGVLSGTLPNERAVLQSNLRAIARKESRLDEE